jgi:galactose-1-phosphate uridylyltransferase
MAELRYNRVTRDWLMVASSRQNRPQMPADRCPFCPADRYSTHITAKRHIPTIARTNESELNALGEIMRDVSAMYDALFDMPFTVVPVQMLT